MRRAPQDRKGISYPAITTAPEVAHESGEDTHRLCFASAIGAKKSGNTPFLDAEGEVIQSRMTGISFREVFDLNPCYLTRHPFLEARFHATQRWLGQPNHHTRTTELLSIRCQRRGYRLDRPLQGKVITLKPTPVPVMSTAP